MVFWLNLTLLFTCYCSGCTSNGCYWFKFIPDIISIFSAPVARHHTIWRKKWEQKHPTFWGSRGLAAHRQGKAVNRVRVPEPVQVCEQLRAEAVVVVVCPALECIKQSNCTLICPAAQALHTLVQPLELTREDRLILTNVFMVGSQL